MAIFVIDTNIYVEALRSTERAEELQRFVATKLPALLFHAVVAQELLAGATTDKRSKEINDALILPFERRGRVVSPSFADWKDAGSIMAALVRRKLMSPGGFKRSFPADCLLAASCARNSLTLITTNQRDFDLIGRVREVSVISPWPI